MQSSRAFLEPEIKIDDRTIRYPNAVARRGRRLSTPARLILQILPFVRIGIGSIELL
jgi:hypothetical protein